MHVRSEADEARFQVDATIRKNGTARTEAPPAAEPSPGDASPPGWAEHVAAIGQHLARLAEVRVDRARHAIAKQIAFVLGMLLAFLVLAVFCGYGAVLFARGLAGTLGALAGDRPWIGELGAGLALLLGTAALGRLAWVLRERRELARKLREYGHDEHE
ncbi:MAG: hypothetical protein HZA53_01500 [Planctomycetes bacterium]|nr:hypothetical protein [Planctomycetota bacterium]